MNISFTETRARSDDPQTSKDAAKHASSAKAAQERIAIFQSLQRGPKNARQIAADTGIDYIVVQRRKGEVAGIEPTGQRLDGCAVWAVVN
jgi:hypothetical protein